ncbi:hypothetical protein IWW50_002905 [Coemansia erecta]|nr:hypothetical protein IWW50_002905 [Coemansia erecta]
MAESAVDDENFELVDYTAASVWEKLVASVESQLRLWRVSDGGTGDFDFEELYSVCSQLVVRHKQDRDDAVSQVAQLCTRSVQLEYNGSVYTLTLSAHPLLTAAPHAKLAAFAQQFPPTHVPELETEHNQVEPEQAWHPLHRWTGSRMLIYFQYAGDPGWADVTSDNYSVSLETAKLLMSSLNMALRNARCQLPAFVPVGDAWRRLYTGRSIVGRHSGVESTKYDCVALPHAPSAYLQLNGLLELFISAFRVLAHAPSTHADTRAKPTSAQDVRNEWDFVSSAVDLAALHQYRVKNTYVREWNTQSADFIYRMGDLNVGPVNDPLRVLTLSAMFQRAPCRTYIDPQAQGRDKLYLKTASSWLLSAHMLAADRERTMLTEALEDAFAAWVQSANARHRHLNMAEQMEAHEEVTSGMLIDLFGSSKTTLVNPPGLADADKLDKEAAQQLDRTLADVYAYGSLQRPMSVTQIIAHMPHGTAVPYGSLLWRLSEIILVATAKRSADFWGAPSIMTFLRLLWAMTLKEIRWRWENIQLLPRIPESAECVAERDVANADSDSPAEAPNQSPVDAEDGINPKYNVHLRYALMHQKLEMINCCVERRVGSGEVPTPLDCDVSAHEASEPAAADPADRASGSENKGLAQRIRTHVKSQIQRRIGESTRMRPIGRLLNTIRTGNHPEVDEFEDIEPSPYASDSDGFVSAEDIDFEDALDANDDDDASALLVDPASLDESLSTMPSMRLPANAVQHPSSTQPEPVGVRESNYVDLALSSSLDSNSGFHHVSNVYEREPSSSTQTRQSSNDSSESLGSDERAGGLRPSPSMRLLKSDEPMWIPRIQAHAVVTEDMLRDRETILMSFGTSAEGAQQRARLQCAELISDMEAFKAANPRCTLADFVRWHSPRDWIVDEGQDEHEGRLSARMAGGEGNLWQQLWAEARRVPVERQQLLFDHNFEAEKALHYLEGISTHSLFASLLPTVFLIAYERLYRQPIIHKISVLRERLLNLGTKIVTNDSWTNADPDNPMYGSIMDDLEDLEVQTSRCVSLLSKLPGQHSLVETLVMCGQAVVDDRAAQKTVLKALSKFNILTAQPTCREYVFTAKLHQNSEACQRMYVSIDDDKAIRVVYSRAKA